MTVDQRNNFSGDVYKGGLWVAMLQIWQISPSSRPSWQCFKFFRWEEEMGRFPNCKWAFLGAWQRIEGHFFFCCCWRANLSSLGRKFPPPAECDVRQILLVLGSPSKRPTQSHKNSFCRAFSRWGGGTIVMSGKDQQDSKRSTLAKLDLRSEVDVPIGNFWCEQFFLITSKGLVKSWQMRSSLRQSRFAGKHKIESKSLTTLNLWGTNWVQNWVRAFLHFCFFFIIFVFFSFSFLFFFSPGRKGKK